MARLKASNEQAVSLFPIFNILVCTLGSLILIIGTVVAFSLGPGRSVLIDIKGRTRGEHHKIPTYIEWDGKKIVIHPERNSVSLDLLSIIELSDEKIEEIKESYIDGRLTLEQARLEIQRRQYNKIMDRIRNTHFEDLLQHIHRKRDKEYLVIMVRPSSFDTLVTLRNFILKTGIDVGYEPIDQGWTLRIR